MLNSLARILLTASAIAPVAFTYAWAALFQDSQRVALLAVAIGVAVLFACLIVIRLSQAKLERFSFDVDQVEPADSENLGFMLLYVLPLFTDKIADLNWAVLLPFVGVYFFVVATGYAYHFNPLLNILGWHFYKVTSTGGVTYVLITRRQIRSTSGTMRVGQLTEYMLIEVQNE